MKKGLGPHDYHHADDWDVRDVTVPMASMKTLMLYSKPSSIEDWEYEELREWAKFIDPKKFWSLNRQKLESQLQEVGAFDKQVGSYWFNAGELHGGPAKFVYVCKCTNATVLDPDKFIVMKRYDYLKKIEPSIECPRCDYHIWLYPGDMTDELYQEMRYQIKESRGWR